tara:strand:- start:473 stop:634 length:162 start_codon:yes stop_codon:yes gene_type:complete
MNEILNGSGQGLRRFELVNGERHWLDMPSNEWQKQALIDNKNNTKTQNEIKKK